MYGPATAYAGWMPPDEELEYVFLTPEAEPRSARPPTLPDLVVLDLEFVGSRADKVRAALASLDPSPHVVAVTRVPSAGKVAGPVSDAEERLFLPAGRDRLATVIAERLRRRTALEVTGHRRLVFDLPPGGIVFDEYERRIIRFALDRHGWNRSRTARELGISRPRLQRKIEKYGLGP